MRINNFLENSAANHPDKVAVIHDDQRVTYAQLNTQANQIANHLIKSGIKPGDRIAILLENNVDYIASYYATLKAGAVAAPLNPGLKPDGLHHLLNHLEPAVIITNFKTERLLKATDLSIPTLKSIIIRTPKQKWPNIPFRVHSLEDTIAKSAQSSAAGKVSVCPCESVANLSTDALASIIYTSGSTGEPKGVMLSHTNIVANTNSICESLKITPTDIQMVVLPFFYVMGKSLLNTHIAAGATVVLNNRFMYPADVVKQMIEERVTSFSGVPSTYAYLLNRSPLASCKDKLTSLRYCSQAGGHMATTIKKALRNALPDNTQIVIMYGATEAAARLTCLEPNSFTKRIKSIGKPIPDVVIRIFDKNGSELPFNTEGELVASGPNIMRGYWKDSHGTARVIDNDGYHTGDFGYRDAEGFLYITGRKDGLLKVGGHMVNPIDIEDFLLDTNLLIEVAVIDIKDKFLGNKLVALVVSKEETLATDLLHGLCAQGLPKYKCPSDIVIVKSLSKNANGKIDRKRCTHIVTV